MKNYGYTAIFFLLAIAVFWLVSEKFMYKLTQTLTNLVSFETSIDGVPNQYGIILHGVVLALLLTLAGHFLLME